MKILILGGAGFVGSSIALDLKNCSERHDITVFDNLHRRGSELNLERFKKHNIQFFHGDIRQSGDLHDIGLNFDLVIDASAEPSVHAGQDGRGLSYLLQTNLIGTLNALEFCRRQCGGMIFLSSSRVYPINTLRGLILDEETDRLSLSKKNDLPGLSAEGVSEALPVFNHGYRSFYGSSKLSSELFVEEYSTLFSLPCIVNRCGVIAGPGQFGKTDQGVFTLWVAKHQYGGSLRYTGFGGSGKQVRDLLHPSDLCQLIRLQMDRLGEFSGDVFSVGGGNDGSVSLKEYSAICREVSGREIPIDSSAKTSPVDIPWFISDTRKAREAFQWAPDRSPFEIAKEISSWLQKDEARLRSLFD